MLYDFRDLISPIFALHTALIVLLGGRAGGYVDS